MLPDYVLFVFQVIIVFNIFMIDFIHNGGILQLSIEGRMKNFNLNLTIEIIFK